MFGTTELEKLRRNTPEKFKEFMTFLATHTMRETAKQFAAVFGKNEKTLVGALSQWNSKYKVVEKARIMVEQNVFTIMPAGGQPAAVQATPEPQTPSPDVILTEEEEKFLAQFRSGDVSFEQMQREFAYRVLRKILADPRHLKASDWLKSEVIKIQREELNLKKEQMERSWAIIFGGFSFPQFCPQCGYDLMPKKHTHTDEAVLSELGDQDATHESMGDSAGISQ